MTEQTQPTDEAMTPCGDCGMPCAPNEYHPYAACLMFKACRNSEVVRANLDAVRGTPAGAASVTKERFSEPLARVINAGYFLANCAFNLAQRPGTEISIGTAQTLSDCRKEWDAACAAHKALPPAQQPAQAQAGAVPLPGSAVNPCKHSILPFGAEEPFYKCRHCGYVSMKSEEFT